MAMTKLVYFSVRVLAVVWAVPYTLIGLSIGSIGLLTGGRMLLRWPLEFCDGGVRWFIEHLPKGDVTAITFGHVVLGRTEAGLDITREHEHVHVRQYERWGPFFGPAYLGCSFVLWLWSRDSYRDNPFEKEAFGDYDRENS